MELNRFDKSSACDVVPRVEAKDTLSLTREEWTQKKAAG